MAETMRYHDHQTFWGRVEAADATATPKRGLHLSAQGCRTRLPWVMVPRRRSRRLVTTPKGVAAYGSRCTNAATPGCTLFESREAQPLQGWHESLASCPKVAEYDNLGL
jgi:hypothetical protein